MSTPFRTSRRVEFSDTDMAGIVHFANFFRFMETAEVDFLRSLGMSAFMIWQGERIAFPRVSASCTYVRPARFEHVLDIEVSIRAIGIKSVTYEVVFSEGGKLVAHGESVGVCCRLLEAHQFESIEIPAEIRERLEATRR